MQHRESNLQIACFQYFRLAYPAFTKLFFAVPNGGRRNAREAAIMKTEGVTAGVADAILLIPNKDFHALCIEFKTDTGRQSEHQKQFQTAVERQGYRYEIVRNFDSFKKLLDEYLFNQPF